MAYSIRIICNEIVREIFPDGYRFIFAYGSGVFKQTGHIPSQNTMIDFVLAVDDPLDWHKRNLAKNPSHYSFVKYFGPWTIKVIQDSFGANTFYNPYVRTSKGLIKYGVISTKKLISDLLDWETLYIAGRLHKPVHIIHIDDDELKNALRVNLLSAIRSALLMLPESFTEQQLYTTIAGLSYIGDIRMYGVEDPEKVKNIVSNQMNEFRKLYSPLLHELKDYVILDYGRSVGQQDMSVSTKHFHLSLLPKNLQVKIAKNWDKKQDIEDVLRAVALDSDSSDTIKDSVSRIVQQSSFTQSSKGILTAGFTKSVIYSLSKLKKMLQSWHHRDL